MRRDVTATRHTFECVRHHVALEGDPFCQPLYGRDGMGHPGDHPGGIPNGQWFIDLSNMDCPEALKLDSVSCTDGWRVWAIDAGS